MKTLKILTRLCKLIWFILTACGLLALNFFISPLVAALRYVQNLPTKLLRFDQPRNGENKKQLYKTV